MCRSRNVSTVSLGIGLLGLHVVANSSSNDDGPSAAILFPRRSFEIGSKRSLSSASGLFVLLHLIAKDRPMPIQVWAVAASIGWTAVVGTMLLYMIFGPG